ncbi:uncharacterized protein LOC111300952 [Durio zibethinus]|uniref:Uncharacterized protein LOC111300952 n=1 Tax=Durio zibethinus TaxID=66656 RepID=A0A6P5ZIN1_DURZI|nr:uncharacterized protein LOC111300952 [Durio zibethinus]
MHHINCKTSSLKNRQRSDHNFNKVELQGFGAYDDYRSSTMNQVSIHTDASSSASSFVDAILDRDIEILLKGYGVFQCDWQCLCKTVGSRISFLSKFRFLKGLNKANKLKSQFSNCRDFKQHWEFVGQERRNSHQDFHLNYVSKRRVPTGPDPIHNRRAATSRQPPGRA